MDLKLLAMALRLRWLWLQRADPSSRLYGQQFHSMRIQTLVPFFNVSVRCVVGSGTSAMFWMDPWLNGQSIALTMLELAAVVRTYRRNRRTITLALKNNARIQYLTGPLTILVLVQYLLLRQQVNIMKSLSTHRLKISSSDVGALLGGTHRAQHTVPCFLVRQRSSEG
jgi:hypothetical protein